MLASDTVRVLFLGNIVRNSTALLQHVNNRTYCVIHEPALDSGLDLDTWGVLLQEFGDYFLEPHFKLVKVDS